MWDTITGWAVVVFYVAIGWASDQPALFWLVGFIGWVGLKSLIVGLSAIHLGQEENKEALYDIQIQVEAMNTWLEAINSKLAAPAEED